MVVDEILQMKSLVDGNDSSDQGFKNTWILKVVVSHANLNLIFN